MSTEGTPTPYGIELSLRAELALALERIRLLEEENASLKRTSYRDAAEQVIEIDEDGRVSAPIQGPIRDAGPYRKPSPWETK